MNKAYKRDLINLLSLVSDRKLMGELLEDLLTPAEFEDFVLRWQIVKYLANKVPQREIAKKLNVSISKITRGSRELLNKNGGFWKAIELGKN